MSDPVYGIPSPIFFGNHYASLAAVPTSYAVALTALDALHAAGGDGEGEVVCVLDTGIATGHPEFAGKILDARSFVPGESVEDGNGHGTHTAGTAAGTSRAISFAPRAKILAGKCLSNAGSGNNSWIEATFRWGVAAGATGFSISIGGPGFLAGMEPLFREADRLGLWVAVAAGNERPQGGLVTAASSAAVVAACDRARRIAPFSNPGASPDFIDIAAPGVDIPSAWPGGGYNAISGTSMSTPLVAGGQAAVNSLRRKRGLPRLSSAGFKALYRTRAVDAGSPGYDRDFGPGTPDFNLMALSLVPNPPEVR